jgi:hypothetical protein
MDVMEHVQTESDFFFLDPKKKESRKGRKYTREMKEVTEVAVPIWENISSQERRKYEEQARRKNKDTCKEDFQITKNPRSRQRGQNNVAVRHSTGVLKRQERLTREVERTVRSLDRQTSLKTYRFHIMHVNYYCKVTNGVYIPCEIAIAEFNLTDGITKTYHTLINPGDIPFGYTFEAQTHAAETHGIPLPPENFDGESNYLKILSNIKLFLKADDRNETNPHPVYSQTSDVEAVESILCALTKAAYPAQKGTFRVLSLPKLFYELRNASIGIVTADLSLDFPADCELQNDIFDYTAGISCYFHENRDTRKYCSLSCVQRWSFVITNQCRRNLRIYMFPGRHYPLSSCLVNEVRSVSPSSRNNCQNTYTFDHDKYFPNNTPGQLLSPQKCGQRVMTKGEPNKEATAKGNEEMKIEPKALQRGRLEPLRRPKTMSVALFLMSTCLIRGKDLPATPAPPNVPNSEAANTTDLHHIKQL